MKEKKLNSIVSMYTKPAFGSVKSSKRVMALSVDKESKNPFLGIAREITKSRGSVDVPGFVDESRLIVVKSSNLLNWEKVKDLRIKGIDKIIEDLSGKDKYFIGLEDPDIWVDEQKLRHVYFTLAFKYKNKISYDIYLGHAQGDSIERLEATPPILSPIGKTIEGFKEVAISPKVNKSRINLTEVEIVDKKEHFSAIAAVKADDMGKPWKYIKIAINPHKLPYSWCNGHMSPCTFLPRDFVTIDDLLVGVINGRERERVIDGQEVYGKFRVGLCLFDPKTGSIPWVSPKPLIEDPKARTITFASDFLQTSKNEGILYAHVNDSFVRAYKINANKLLKFLPNEL